MSLRPKTALTVAGSDSGGGAGIQADLKAFAALEVHGLSAITALTAQSTVEVRGVYEVPAAFVRLQLETLADDFPIDAAKTGMLPTPEIIEAVAAFFSARSSTPLVVDPVIVASSGALLISPEAIEAIRSRLFPLATLITPNLDEVEALIGVHPRSPSMMAEAGRRLLEMGPRAVLVKGGHLEGDPIDVLMTPTGERRFGGPRIDTNATHGTGCTYAAAITAFVARGFEVTEAVEAAHGYLRSAIEHAPKGLGHGHGPLHPLHRFFRF